ncbi:MAG: hypothetical protein ACYC35_25585, partial [Pirellulales bacterium]
RRGGSVRPISLPLVSGIGLHAINPGGLGAEPPTLVAAEGRAGETLAALADATEPVKRALGANPDLWQRAEESRIR